MQTDLRPMSLGEILDRTAQLYRENFLLFAGIAAVYAGVLLVISLVQIGVNTLLMHLHMIAKLPWVSAGFILIMAPAIFICAGAALAANNRAVAWVNLGQPATIRCAYQSILPRLGRYLWLMTIIAFFIYIPFAIIFTGYFIFLFAYGRPRGLFASGAQHASGGVLGVFALVSVVAFLLLTAACVYAVIMGLRYSLAVPASVLEDLKARKAIRRSIELSKGSRGRIFLLGLLIAAIQVGLASLTQIFFIFSAIHHKMVVPAWEQVLQQIVGFFTNSFIGPMYATGLTLFYYDQRIRKEGFDIERMMEAAGMNPDVPPMQTPPATEDSDSLLMPVEAIPYAAESEPPAATAEANAAPAERETAPPENLAPQDSTLETAPPENNPPENTPPENSHG
jgi:hypothetical protein